MAFSLVGELIKFLQAAKQSSPVPKEDRGWGEETVGEHGTWRAATKPLRCSLSSRVQNMKSDFGELSSVLRWKESKFSEGKLAAADSTSSAHPSKGSLLSLLSLATIQQFSTFTPAQRVSL